MPGWSSAGAGCGSLDLVFRRRPHSLRRKTARSGRSHAAEDRTRRNTSLGGRRCWADDLVRRTVPFVAASFPRGEGFAPTESFAGGRFWSRRRASRRGAHLQPDTRRPLSSAVSRPPDLVPRDLVPRDLASCISTSIVATHHRGTAAACAAGGGTVARWWAPAIGARPQGVIPEPTRRACRPCTMAPRLRCARQSPHVPLPPVGPLPTPGPAESACRQVGRHIAEHRETRLTPDRSSAAAVSDRSAAAPDPASDQDGRCSRT